MSVVAVVIVPLLAAALLVTTWSFPQIRRIVSLVASVSHVGVAAWLFRRTVEFGIQSHYLGGWPPPFGIEFSADLLSASLVLTASIVGLMVLIYAQANIGDERREFGFHPLFFVLLAGVCGAFSTGDMFNMFVWFECVLLSSFVLLSLGGEKQQIRGAINYVIPNLLSSTFFLVGLGLIYGATGTLNMADLAQKIPLLSPGLATAISVLFLTAFAIKAAVFPFFTWLPASYHTPPAAVSALFAGLLTKVGVYALIRFFTFVYPLRETPINHVLSVACLLTVLVGSIGALAHRDFKRALAYLLIGHIGIMLYGLVLKTPAAMSASIFYVLNHILVMTCLYFAAGIVEWHYGTTNSKRVGSMLQRLPWLAYGIAIPALSLAGIPPLSGFWPKWVLVRESFSTGNPAFAIALLASSFLTLWAMARLWTDMVLKPAEESAPYHPKSQPGKVIPAAALALAIILLGFFPSVLAQISDRTVDPQEGKFISFFNPGGGGR